MSAEASVPPPPVHAATPGRGAVVFGVVLVVAAAGGWALGAGFGWLLRPAQGASPHGAMAASFFLHLFLTAGLLAALPDVTRSRWPYLKTWLKAAVAGAMAHAGLALAATETARVFVVLAALFAAFAGLWLSVDGLLAILLRPFPRVARSCLIFVVALAATALLWSREPIQLAAQIKKEAETPLSTRMTDAVLRLSPPAAVASAWYFESDAARHRDVSESTRFDLIRAPMTYGVWIGSYQAAAYPAVLPDNGPPREPGLLMILFVWSLPLLLVFDLRIGWRQRAEARAAASVSSS